MVMQKDLTMYIAREANEVEECSTEYGSLQLVTQEIRSEETVDATVDEVAAAIYMFFYPDEVSGGED
jgi:hypothetical protein